MLIFIVFLFFCLETKETKIQGFNFLCYKLGTSAKRFELAMLRQQIVLNALMPDLLDATKFNALTSLRCGYSITNIGSILPDNHQPTTNNLLSNPHSRRVGSS